MRALRLLLLAAVVALGARAQISINNLVTFARPFGATITTVQASPVGPCTPANPCAGFPNGAGIENKGQGGHLIVVTLPGAVADVANLQIRLEASYTCPDRPGCASGDWFPISADLTDAAFFSGVGAIAATKSNGSFPYIRVNSLAVTPGAEPMEIRYSGFPFPIASVSIDANGVVNVKSTGPITIGPTTIGDCVEFDAGGNLVDAGGPCSTGATPHNILSSLHTDTICRNDGLHPAYTGFGTPCPGGQPGQTGDILHVLGGSFGNEWSALAAPPIPNVNIPSPVGQSKDFNGKCYGNGLVSAGSCDGSSDPLSSADTNYFRVLNTARVSPIGPGEAANTTNTWSFVTSLRDESFGLQVLQADNTISADCLSAGAPQLCDFLAVSMGKFGTAFPSPTIEAWGPSASINIALKPKGAGVVGTSGTWVAKPSANVASAATTALPVGNLFHITGSTNITTLNTCDSSYNGRTATLIFNGALTFTDGNNLKLSGNFGTAADSTITLVCDGSNWYEMARSAN